MEFSMDIAKPIAPRSLSISELSMSALVILDSISLATPDGRSLFDGLSLAIGRERTALSAATAAASHALAPDRRRDRTGGRSVRRAGSIGVLAQLADDRLSVAQALGVSEGLATCTGLNAARFSR